jgi:hypothetical protein
VFFRSEKEEELDWNLLGWPRTVEPGAPGAGVKTVCFSFLSSKISSQLLALSTATNAAAKSKKTFIFEVLLMRYACDHDSDDDDDDDDDVGKGREGKGRDI